MRTPTERLVHVSRRGTNLSVVVTTSSVSVKPLLTAVEQFVDAALNTERRCNIDNFQNWVTLDRIDSLVTDPVVKFLDSLCGGTPQYDHPGVDVLSDGGSGGDDGSRTDFHTGPEDRVRADEDPIVKDNSLEYILPENHALITEFVGNTDDTTVGPNLHVGPDVSVFDVAPGVDIDLLADVALLD